MVKKGIFGLLIILTLFLAACSSDKDKGAVTPFVGGKEGIVAQFTTGMPPDDVFDNSQMVFGIQTKLENKGEADIAPGNLYVEITGISPTSFGKTSQADFKKFNDILIKGTKKNFAGDIVNGDTAWITFEGLKYVHDLPGNQGFIVRADICYLYTTKATAKVCMNRDIVKNVGKESICTLSGLKEVSNSGAPIQVLRVKEDPVGGGKVQLNIEVGHVGPGDGFFKMTEPTCNLSVANMNKYKVKITVQPNNNNIGVTCNGLEEGAGNSGYITLWDGQPRSVACILDLNAIGDAVFEELVNIKLDYRYLQHIQKTLVVKDVSTGS